ncbi:AAA family ATPase [Oceanobacillus neutriphilus]|uniref:Nuclease SbcCD subunit C n=1 Tax=Oceanobacillus neutriphilus TaxID=531815 RepID=A0ABQ2NZC6_9BACI|nr:SMC family ATPase [Oceanobacillus neutriphilus]GGP14338.1 nuclease SbcCD subunit C [Oceanobacillus neutriphilus]
MRPLQLTLNAFGPYKEKEIIDFEELRGNTLFVISGKTGAGKTTLFDGIAFALYGKASGSDREDQRMLRSDFADEDIHTSAELVFQIQDKTYRIFRQLGHVKNGNKSKTGDKCEFYEVREEGESPCVDRQMVSEIDQRIEEIIGLTPDQFKQIVMLPQGEFRKLLTSGTENKEEILRRLFKTEHYKYMNELLKEKKAKLEQENQRILNRMEQLRAQIFSLELADDSDIHELAGREHVNAGQIIEALESELAKNKEVIEKADSYYKEAVKQQDFAQNQLYQVKQINEYFSELEIYQKNLTAWKDQAQEMAALKEGLYAAEQAKLIIPYEQQRNEARKEFQEGNQALQMLEAKRNEMEKQKQQAEDTYKKEQENAGEREKVSIEVNRLEGFLPVVKELEAKKKEIQNLAGRLKRDEEQLEKLTGFRKAQSQQIDRLEKEEQLLDKDKDKLEEVKEELRILREQAMLMKKYKEKVVQIQTGKAALKDKEAVYLKEKESYNRLEHAWFANQAHVLAVHLHGGEPCPVCGSLDHPSPAATKEAEVSKEELERAKKLMDEKESIWREQTANIRAYQSEGRELEQELTQHELEFSDPEQRYQEIVEKGKQKKAEESHLEQSKVRLSECKKELVSMRQEQKQSETAVNKQQNQVSQLQSEYQSKQAVYQQQYMQIPENLRVLTDLEAEISGLRTKKQQLEQRWIDVQDNYRKVHEAFTKWTADVHHLRENQAKWKQKMDGLEKTFQEKLEQSGFTKQAYQEAKWDEAAYQSVRQRLTDYEKQGYQLEKQISELEKKLEGKSKQDLSEIEAVLDKWKQETKSSLEQLQQLQQEKKDMTFYMTQLQEFNFQSADVEKQRMVITDLYDTLRGQNPKKVSFERYLQMEYLEQIIEAANLRLNDLSNGQFYLTRSDRQESRGKQSGLGLDVYDQYTGQTRDVKTLSGGEKFHASLCLALGMSDVIQSFQGNIVIQTMFIDEGFGSLDEESLRKAIDALIQLQQSGRMIGVISHVQELKDVFPAAIEVHKTKEGYSKTEIIVK